MRIDSHQHFWHYDPLEHTWMTAAMPALKNDFLPTDLMPLMKNIGFGGCIAVQARQSIAETNWLLELAATYNYIKGVVGWVDLRSPTIQETLAQYISSKKLVGVRHVIHDEPDDHFMLNPSFQNGIANLKEFDLTYDLLLYPKHLPVAIQLVEKFPEQPFVIDHIAKPDIKNKGLSPWKEDLKALAQFPNVYCKLSGMVTEAAWGNWANKDFDTYLNFVLEAFGTKRVMIGSDWPVCTLSGSYQQTMDIVIQYAGQFPNAICEDILGNNCQRFYKLKD